MLRSSKDRKYNYSRYICLKSAREIIYRYLALRYRERTFCCKVIDFAPLTATITLFLGLMDPPIEEETGKSKHERDCDKALAHTLLQSMEGMYCTMSSTWGSILNYVIGFTAGGGSQDIAISKSVNVIKALLEVESSSCATNSLRITVPYFGTINIIRTINNCNSSTSMVQHQDDMPDQSQLQQDLLLSQPKGINAPMVQFTSSQFAPLPIDQSLEDWDLPEADTLFFDGLLNTDIEGNWMI